LPWIEKSFYTQTPFLSLMEELALQQPELVGREEELNKLRQSLDNAIEGKGSTVFIAGEAGIGKTRLVSELIKYAESRGAQVIRGWCLAESLEPLMPIKTALREAGLFHLISGEPPPLLVSAYLMNEAGLLIAKSESEDLGFDPDIFSSMLKAVGAFVKDTMQMIDHVERTGGLNILGFKDFKILIEECDGLYLASVTKGSVSEFLINDMRDVLSEVHKGYGIVLTDWNGDLDKTEGVESIVSKLVTSGKYSGRYLVDDPKIRQENLLDNVLLGIHRLSAERPVLLFLDDIQWANPSTLVLLQYLSRNTRNHRVSIVGAYRPEDILQSWDGKTHQLESVMQNMSREDLLDKIELKRLDVADTEKIIVSTLNKVQLDKSFFDKVYGETEGTPFFVLELVKLLVEDGTIAQDEGGAWNLVTELEQIDIPSKVYDVIKRRLDRLIKKQRKILECASVVGEEFRSDVVGKTMRMDRMQLLETLSEIEKAHRLIHSIQKRYKFDHAKIREVLYNGIIDEMKEEYHRIIADTIAELHKDDVDEVLSELAYHYYKAKDDRAGEYLLKAGDKAEEKYANLEAMRFYRNAIELLKDDATAEILEKLGDVQALIGEFDNAIENFDKAGNSAKDNEARARMLRKISDVHLKKGEYDKALSISDRAKALIKDEKIAELGRLCVGDGNAHWRMGEYDSAMALFLEAMNKFERFGAEEKDLGKALLSIGNIHVSRGEYEPALQYYEKSLGKMEKIDDLYGMGAANNNIGNVYYHTGELDRALEFYERGLTMMEKIGNKYGIAHSLGNIGIIYQDKGELDKALEFHKRSLIREIIGDKQGIASSYSNIGDVMRDMGDLDKALDFHERSLKICMEIGEKRLAVHNYCALTELRLGLEDTEIALKQAEKAVDVSLEIDAKPEEGMSHRVVGMVYREKGEWDKAAEAFERSMEILGASRRDELARTYYEYGLLWKKKGEPSKARKNLGEALSEFTRMGMKLWIENCGKALEELDEE
jgi:tetratricopeptide (TPR) repeat protein